MAREWRFYVYELLNGEGGCAYIGKGSGKRLTAQKSNFKLSGHELARFKREKDAYRFERHFIAERKPALNKHPGGNGSWSTPVRPYRKTADEREIDRVGPRVYAARMVIEKWRAFNYLRSKVDYPAELIAVMDSLDIARMREVANGPRA